MQCPQCERGVPDKRVEERVIVGACPHCGADVEKLLRERNPVRKPRPHRPKAGEAEPAATEALEAPKARKK